MFIRLSAVAGLAVLASGALAQTAQSPAAPAAAPSCASPEYRQFDFWVGAWDVYRSGRSELVAHSLIERLYDGCAIRENWMPLQGSGGGSLNAYVPGAGEWRQTWVDSANSWVEFRGGLADGAMVLTGTWRGMAGPGSEPLVRITYSREPDGSVRQRGESSADAGASWTPAFDLTYRRAADR